MAAWRRYVARFVDAHTGKQNLPVRGRICAACPTVYGRVHRQMATALGTMDDSLRLQMLRRLVCVLDRHAACRAAYVLAAPRALDG